MIASTTAKAPRPAQPRASRRYPDVEVRAAVENIPLHLLLPMASVLPVELQRDARDRAVRHVAETSWPNASRWCRAVSLSYVMKNPDATDDAVLRGWVERLLRLNGGKALGPHALCAIMGGLGRG